MNPHTAADCWLPLSAPDAHVWTCDDCGRRWVFYRYPNPASNRWRRTWPDLVRWTVRQARDRWR
jgi:hypothetical protein